MMKTRTRFLGLTLAAALAALTVGCTSDYGEVTPPDPADTSAPEFTLPQADPELQALLPDDFADVDTIQVGASFTGAPYNFRDPSTNEGVGAFVDLVDAASALLGLKTEYQELPYASQPPALAAGTLSIVASPFSASPANLEKLNVISLMSATTSILTLKGNPSGIEAKDDLCGLTLGLVTGSASDIAAKDAMQEECAAQGLPAMEILEYPGNGPAMTAIRSESIAGLFNTTPVGAYQLTLSDTFELVLTGELDKPRVLGVALDKSRLDLAEAYMAAFERLYEDGTYQLVADKWGQSEMTLDAPILNEGA